MLFKPVFCVGSYPPYPNWHKDKNVIKASDQLSYLICITIDKSVNHININIDIQESFFNSRLGHQEHLSPGEKSQMQLAEGKHWHCI